MLNSGERFRRWWLLVALLLLVPHTADATNGMNMIGYGAVSSAMGGADLALSDNVMAMNINPAGLSGCCGAQLSIGDSVMQSRNHHQDHHGNDLTASEDAFHLPLLAWAQPLPAQSLIVGLGLFAQGGMGVTYRQLRMPFADAVAMADERDELSSSISYMKLTPTVAWYSEDRRLKLGISLNAGYAEAAMKLFPHTSLFVDNNGDGDGTDDGELAFAGMDFHDSRAFASGLRFGFQYQIGSLTIGGAYLTATDLDFNHGTTRINYSAMGLGGVDYDTRLSGFNWPRQAGLGVSYQCSSRLKIAADVDWINWSAAVKNIQFRLSHPNSSAAPALLSYDYPMQWHDQWVFAIGAEYRLNHWLVVRGGYNHGNNPVPARNLLPFFPAISEDHITAGVGMQWQRWQLDVAAEWALETRVHSNNSLYCHHGFEEQASQFTSHLTLSYNY